MQSEFEENLLAKEEELIIMNNLMNNPCETEPMSKFLSFEEQLISKYEKIIKEMKDEFERDFIDLQHNYERELKKNMKEREKLLNEISNQKQEIYQLKLFIPNNKEKAQTYRDSQNSGRLLTQEGKDKVLQNLLFKIK